MNSDVSFVKGVMERTVTDVKRSGDSPALPLCDAQAATPARARTPNAPPIARRPRGFRGAGDADALPYGREEPLESSSRR